MKRKIIIVEPSEIIKTGLKSLIDSSVSLEVVACVDDLSNIEEKIAYHRPDVIVTDPAVIPYSRQMALPQAMTDEANDISNVAIVHQYVAPPVARLFDASIDINDSRETIAETLSTLESDNKHGKRLTDNSDLTKRETDILILVAKGMMSKEIADKLNISIHTVISHRKNITKKTGIKSVAGLAVYAMINNLIDEA